MNTNDWTARARHLLARFERSHGIEIGETGEPILRTCTCAMCVEARLLFERAPEDTKPDPRSKPNKEWRGGLPTK